MNKIQQKQKLDKSVLWTITYSPAQNTELNYDDYDSVLKALRDDKNHWKHLEDKSDDTMKLYSDCCTELISKLEGILNAVDDAFTGDIGQLLSTVQAKNATSTEGILSGNPRSSGGRMLPVIKLRADYLPVHSNSIDFYDYGYKELYLANMKQTFQGFLTLIQNPSQLRQYLASTSNYDHESAIHFLGLSIKKYTYPTNKLIVKERLRDIGDNISTANQRLADLRKEAEDFVAIEGERLEQVRADRAADYTTLKEDIENWYAKKQAELTILEETYNEKLRLAAPVAFWQDKAVEKKKGFKIWVGATLIFSVALVAAVTVLFCIAYSQPSGALGQLVPMSFVVIALIAVLIYAVKTLVKLTLAERHLSIEFEERAAFTHFYLSLMQNQKVEISPDEKLLIYNAIFAHADTGLVKSSGDSGIGALELFKAISRP